MGENRSGRAWKREDSPTQHILDELARRRLTDLDTCRAVWETEDDPLALMEAVRLLGLPEWLEDALLLAVSDGTLGHPVFAKEWRRRSAAAVDRARAEAVASGRSKIDEAPVFTWDVVLKLADLRVRRVYRDVPAVSADAVKKSYQRVAKGLKASPGKYFTARADMGARVAAARIRAEERVGQRLAAKVGNRASRSVP